MNKPSRQPDVLAVIQRSGPITTAKIAARLGIHISSVHTHLTSMAGAVHVGDWQHSYNKDGRTKWSAMWVDGPGENAPMPKDRPRQARTSVVVDLDSMPYRSVFAGGVSPWAGMAA